ncbi:MAG: molybdopterin-dependent oxidoreductase, partial [Caulobacterales bacterium]|nr:molybdopterin-dependent oxidoreductase [Caulobacterales bacterium]
MTDRSNLSRRGFMIGSSALGAGLTITLFAGCSAAQDEGGEAAPAAAPNPEVNAWVHIGADDVVTIRIARSEMGQGTLTGLAQLVAEELECDWDKVVTEYPTPGQNLARERVWGDFQTGGSQGLRGSHQYVREGGAAARMMLIEAAANAWGVSPDECSAKNSLITHGPSGRATTYGAVAGAAAELAPPVEIPLKDPADWTVAGTSKLRLDTPDKITGKQIYGADITMPGMLNASIKACPKRGGTLASFEAAAVSDMPGVRHVLQVGEDAVAVVADTWWQANTALEALPIAWEPGPGSDHSSAAFEAELDDGLTAEQAFPLNQGGDVEAAFASAAQVVEATYNMPHQNHATMEPMNATALWTEDKCEVWCPTQNGEAALAAAAEAAGLPVEQCEVHKLHLGGGFGRRLFSDYVSQTIAIAKQIPGTPVKLMWSREEDMQQGFYHPATKARLRGAVNADGELTGLHMRISGQSILAALMPQALFNGADVVTFQGLLPSGLDPRVEDQTLKYELTNFKFDHAMR